VLEVGGALRLFASALLARLPQGMSSLAVLLLVRESTHSYAAAGVAVGAEALMSAASAPVIGRLIDRLGRERVLVPCALSYALALALLVVAAQAHAGGAVLVVLSALAGALLPPIAPTVRALLRDVFAEESVRERAYALEAVAQELIWIAGPLIVAAVIAFASPAIAVLLLGAQSVAGTLLFVRAPLARRPGADVDPSGRAGALASRALRGLLVPIALMGSALGATEVGLPALALHAGSRSDTGVLLALWSLGSMTGGLWFGGRVWRASLWTRYAVLLVAAVACTAPLIAARSLAAGAVCTVLSGLTIAPVFSCQYALVGHSVTPGTETEAFTWVTAALVTGIAVGSAAGGGLVSAAGFSSAFVFAVAATACAAAMALVTRAAAQRRAETVACAGIESR
jgi:MFS family permease